MMISRWREERADRRAWRRAVSWPELCEQMALFVESLEPGSHDDVLARVNRAGYLIHTARPGVTDRDGGDLYESRAAVSGFVLDMDLYESIARVADRYGLLLLARSVRIDGDVAGFAVERVNGKAGAELGQAKSVAVLRDEAEHLTPWKHLNPVGHELLYVARQVTVIDPTWGGDDLLWTALDEAVRRAGITA